MAAGAAPAPEKKLETKEAEDNAPSQPKSLKDRIIRRLHQIFEGRQEYLGWHQ